MHKFFKYRNLTNRCRMLSISALIFLSLLSHAIDIQSDLSEKNWFLTIEPDSLRAPVGKAFSASKKTLQVPVILINEEPHRLTTPEFLTLRTEWDTYQKQAAENANRILNTCEPEFFRNAKGVITHAVIRSENPLTVSLIFASQFLEHFESVFGSEILVAVPNRNTVYIFPKLASSYQSFGVPIMLEYENAAYPCSTELFEINTKGIRAVGDYNQR